MTRFASLFSLVSVVAFGQTYPAGMPARASGGTSGAGTATEWYTVFECDLTAEPAQTLSTNGSYTFCGKTWTKASSTGDATAMALVPGTGLVIQPVSATDFSPTVTTAPHVWLNATDLIPAFSVSRQYRLSVHLSSSNCAANFDSLKVGFWSPAPAANLLFVALNYAGAGGCNPGYYVAKNNTGINYGTAISTTPLDTDDVEILEMPSGLTGFFGSWTSGAWASGWPEDTTVNAVASMYPPVAGSFTYGVPRSSWRFVITGQRAGSGTALSLGVGHIKIEYR